MPLTPEQKQMVEDNIKLATYMTKRYVNRIPLEYSELFSICSEALCKAAVSYDPQRKWKFSTIACMTMKRGISDRLQNDRHINDIYLEDMDYNPITVMPPVEEIVDMQNAISMTLRLFRGSRREKAVAITFVRDPYLSQCEIAEKTGVAQKTVSTAIKSFKQQLQEVI